MQILQATQRSPKHIAEMGKSLDAKLISSGSISVPTLADPSLLEGGGTFEGHAFTRWICSTFGEDNYLKIMLVSRQLDIVHESSSSKFNYFPYACL